MQLALFAYLRASWKRKECSLCVCVCVCVCARARTYKHTHCRRK